MTRTSLIFFFFIYFIGCQLSWAASLQPRCQQFIDHEDWNFVENKGQLADAAGNLLTDIKYYGHPMVGTQGGVYVYCRPGMISFVFTRVEKKDVNDVSEATGYMNSNVGVQNFEPLRERKQSNGYKTTTCRTDLTLIGSNSDAAIIANDQQAYYENFYLAHRPDAGITHVHSYKTITYKSIYPHIDMVLHCKDNGLKYEFIVHAGGKMSDIQMQWNGLQSMETIENGGISYGLALGKMEEGGPLSFQGDKIIKSGFSKDANRVGFIVGKYDKTKTLGIDPTLVWGTYFGGAQSDAGRGLAKDSFGNIYMAGTTSSTSGIATNGAFETAYISPNIPNRQGIAFLAKFSNSGSRLWATYYGDSASGANGVTCDASGSIYVVGTTRSNTGIASNGSYKTSNSGDGDAFLVKFNGNGSRQWGTYFGGAGSDLGNGVTTDNIGNVYIVGETSSKTGIATSDAYQTFLGGDDAFLAKFSSKGIIQWSTYFGGPAIDRGMGVATDASGNVFIAGNTESDTGLTTKNAYQPTKSGSDDAFLAKFSNFGKILWATYYGGRSEEYLSGIATGGDAVYICGGTQSSSGIATSGAFETQYDGGTSSVTYNAFLAKFNQNGALEWGTYYCAGNFGTATAVTTDKSGFVYITGYTICSTGITTNDAYEKSYDFQPLGSPFIYFGDAFLVKFNSQGARQWGTYFGDVGGANGACVVADDSGHIYLTGNTLSTNGIVTSGAFQTKFAGPVIDNNFGDAFLAKFYVPEGYDVGVAQIVNPVSNFCAGELPVKVNLKNYGSKEIDSVNISWSVNRVMHAQYDWKGKLAPDSSVIVNLGNDSFPIGIDSLKCWTLMPNGAIDSVPANDSSLIVFTVNALPLAPTGPPKTICENSVVTLGSAATTGDVYSWTSKPSGFNSTDANPPVKPLKSTRFYLTEVIAATGCSKMDSVLITVIPKPITNTGGNKAICIGDSVQMGDIPILNETYKWHSLSDTWQSTLSNPVVAPVSKTLYLLTVTDTITGCTNADTITVTVNNLPIADIGQKTYQICTGTHIKIGANPKPGLKYSWISLPLGFSALGMTFTKTLSESAQPVAANISLR